MVSFVTWFLVLFLILGSLFYDVKHVYLRYPNDLVRDIWIYRSRLCVCVYVCLQMMAVDLILTGFFFISLLYYSINVPFIVKVFLEVFTFFFSFTKDDVYSSFFYSRTICTFVFSLCRRFSTRARDFFSDFFLPSFLAFCANYYFILFIVVIHLV